jgi:hypothetical protein
VGITCVVRETPDGDGSDAGGGEAVGVTGSMEIVPPVPEGDMVPVVHEAIVGH